MGYKVTWGSAPVITFDLSYDLRRAMGEQQYKITVSCEPCSGTHYFGYPIYLEIKLDGKTAATRTLKAASPSQWTTAISYTTEWLTVPNKTSGSTDIAIRIYSGSGSTRNKTYNIMALVNPVASKIAATDIEIGGVGSGSNITITKYNSNYTTTISYKAEGQSLYTVIFEKQEHTTFFWSPPTSLWNLIPADPELEITLACMTFDGDILVGSESIKIKAYATAAKCKPTVGISSKVTDPESIALTGSNKRIIPKISTVNVEAAARANYGATITSIQLYCGGRSVSGTNATFQGAMLGGVYAIATDSRGFSTRIDDTTLSYCLYSAPTMVPTITRDTPTGDTVTVSVRGRWFNEYFGGYVSVDDNKLVGSKPFGDEGNYAGVGVANTLRVRARYKVTSASEYGDYVDIPVEVVGNEYQATINLSGIAYTSIYNFQIRLDDAIYSDDSGVLGSKYSIVTVSKGLPIFDWGEDSFNFNVPVTINGAGIMVPKGDYLGVDLDDLKNVNGWYIGANAPTEARGCRNFPTDTTGMLLVFGMGSFAYQTYSTYDGRIFTRAYYEVSGWSAWKQLQMV